MESFKPPGEMQFSADNVAKYWKKWIQEFHNFMLASEKINKPDNVKIAMLLNLLGEEGLKIYNTFEHSPYAPENFEEVLKRFEEYCNLRKNVVYERFIFFSCEQCDGQTFDSYLTQLKILAESCEFGDQEESLIRDRILLSIKDSSLLEQMLCEPSLSLNQAIQFVRAAEIIKEQLTSKKGNTNQVMKAYRTEKDKYKDPSYNCKKCGQRHCRAECPAYGKLCNKCKKKGHFAVGCTKKNIQ